MILQGSSGSDKENRGSRHGHPAWSDTDSGTLTADSTEEHVDRPKR